MRIPRSAAVAGATLLVMSGCVTVTLAPGADRVHVTTLPSDVSNCVAVGNLKATRGADGAVDGANAAAEIRNQTVGLGGNAAFVSAGSVGVPLEGIAYRCP